MPLYADGLRKIRRNLEQVQAGERPRVVKIGFFTPEQIAQINKARTASKFLELDSVIVFHGSICNKSRCVNNPYTIDQVLEQIQSAFSENSVVDTSRPSIVLRNPNPRTGYEGRLVKDEVIFECTGRYPHAELHSVIPRGDGRPKGENAKGPLEE